MYLERGAAKTVQRWSLLFAGALAGVIGSFLFTQHEKWFSVNNGLFYAVILLVVLLILGAFPFRRIADGFLCWRSKKEPYIIGGHRGVRACNHAYLVIQSAPITAICRQTITSNTFYQCMIPYHCVIVSVDLGDIPFVASV